MNFVMKNVLLILVACLATEGIDAASSCDFKDANFTDFRIQNFLGTWYSIYHYPQDFAKKYSCFIDTYKKSRSGDGDISVSSSVYVKSDKKRVYANGTIQVSNNVLNTTYPDLQQWSGLYHVFATDYTRFAILAGCPELSSNEPDTWIAFRRKFPEDGDIEAAKKSLQPFGLNFNNFIRDCTVFAALWPELQ